MHHKKQILIQPAIQKIKFGINVFERVFSCLKESILLVEWTYFHVLMYKLI